MPALAAKLFPGTPLVGYEVAEDLQPAIERPHTPSAMPRIAMLAQ